MSERPSSNDLPGRYGGFFASGVPVDNFPEEGMAPRDAFQMISEDVALDGDPHRNLATFVTTWMEPEAQMLIARNLHRNFIDHAEYPRTADIEKRCIRMLADLFGAADVPNAAGTATEGSSEAIMLAGLAAKWRWRNRRKAAGLDESKPNLVFGGDVHVVWMKLCRYFDIEPRIIPLQPGKYTVGPDDVAPLLDGNTIAVAGVLGTTFTGEADDIAGIDKLLVGYNKENGLDIGLHVDAASGGFVWPFLYPDARWDFRLETVKSINVSGHKFGMVYPGVGWLIFRDDKQLPDDLVFYENYLGQLDATFNLNFSGGSSMILAQYYNLCRFGKSGYRELLEEMATNAKYLSDALVEGGRFELVGSGEQLPLAAFKLKEGSNVTYDEFDVVGQLASERGWMLPAYTLPPNAESVTIIRALVKENVSHAAGHLLLDDIERACSILDKKGALTDEERSAVKRGHDY